MSLLSITTSGIYPTYRTGELSKMSTAAKASQAQADSAVVAPAEIKTAAIKTDSASAIVDTNQGTISLNFDDYFTPKSNIDFDGPNAPPLLFPSAQNIDALSAHVSQKMQEMLTANNIPSAPSKITYDQGGNMVLPNDYVYADQFKDALAKDPAMQRELSTLNALTSHFSAMKDSIAFSQEYSAASNKAQVDAVLSKYRYLFSNNQRYAQIALEFSPSGVVSATADGKPYNPASYRQDITA